MFGPNSYDKKQPIWQVVGVNSRDYTGLSIWASDLPYKDAKIAARNFRNRNKYRNVISARVERMPGK